MFNYLIDLVHRLSGAMLPFDQSSKSSENSNLDYYATA